MRKLMLVFMVMAMCAVMVGCGKSQAQLDAEQAALEQAEKEQKAAAEQARKAELTAKAQTELVAPPKDWKTRAASAVRNQVKDPKAQFKGEFSEPVKTFREMPNGTVVYVWETTGAVQPKGAADFKPASVYFAKNGSVQGVVVK
jgi:hypothetical protein